MGDRAVMESPQLLCKLFCLENAPNIAYQLLYLDTTSNSLWSVHFIECYDSTFGETDTACK